MNKSQLKEKARAMLNGFPIGHPFPVDSAEHKFLSRIFQGHPEYSLKKGCGIASIFISTGETYKTTCFFIKRTDGTTTDISYIRSIDGASSKISDIKCACRSAIKNVIQDFRATVNFGVDICPVSGEVLQSDNTHIDHYDLIFNEVVELWMKPLPIDTLHCLLNGTNDHEDQVYFIAEEIIGGFIDFHNKHTHLRAVTKTANLSTLKRK